MSTTPVSPTSHVIHGIQALHYPHGWYVPVAERLRILHQLGTPMSVLSGDVLTWHTCPFYRACIEVDGCRYIGDADLHLDAAPGTPDATNPISCGQTAAIGQALECAGFGDLKSLLARVHP
ncbi:MAG TPA: hypothetical protein VHD63_28830, partial [Ktedonobacteraceae bacterium]|nr:hypothetical protein [Ktedonobacteraceae bacterium]